MDDNTDNNKAEKERRQGGKGTRLIVTSSWSKLKEETRGMSKQRAGELTIVKSEKKESLIELLRSSTTSSQRHRSRALKRTHTSGRGTSSFIRNQTVIVSQCTLQEKKRWGMRRGKDERER
ncbi:hypothetical protein CgunFtcFv8_006947 [Champsocephalus gunnari]|uniref:Uncharacterized protein n=1 Tax=Champsocephalus gunnari TaxID=52237 RepID=A0AAN8CGE9_CHAGU|nr:hypothetical protein CgunFtcFv8_006947 [Champsocephalus gunnari]